MLEITEHLLAAAHLLSGTAWFGALVYRTFFVDSKALKFFKTDGEFEHFSLALSHNMRYVVLLSLVTCGVSGFVLAGLRWNPSQGWLTLIGVKTALWFVAFGLFGYISWSFWPKRVFATGDEVKTLRRQGFVVSVVMIGIAAAGMVLGQVAKQMSA